MSTNHHYGLRFIVLLRRGAPCQRADGRVLNVLNTRRSAASGTSIVLTPKDFSGETSETPSWTDVYIHTSRGPQAHTSDSSTDTHTDDPKTQTVYRSPHSGRHRVIALVLHADPDIPVLKCWPRTPSLLSPASPDRGILNW